MFTDKISKTDLNKIIEHFGKNLQLLKLSEEAGEVNRAIIRHEVGTTKTNYEITEELADVLVVVMQLMEIYNINESELEQIMIMKVAKTFDKYDIR
jgi:NTP pyrophosphatase (non-canonical NTP hydrolase)